jgi:hypothetical protein
LEAAVADSPAPTPEFFGIADAAALVGVTQRSLARAVAQGRCKAAVTNGRGDRRLALAWVREWLEREAEDLAAKLAAKREAAARCSQRTDAA